MSRVPTVRKADLDRVLKALKDAGLTCGAVLVRPGGEVVITPAPAGEAPPTLTATPAGEQPADLDSWRVRKDGRRAS